MIERLSGLLNSLINLAVFNITPTFSDKGKAKEDTELVPTLPDVKQHAAKAIGRAAKSSEYHCSFLSLDTMAR